MGKSTTTPPAVYRTELSLPGRRQGKVRDVYEVPSGGDRPAGVLIVASDRVSAFDVVLPTPVPGKGRMLTDISTRWFHFFRERGIITDHLVSTDPADVPGVSAEERIQLEGRMMLGRACRVIPIECVVRGYLAGSGWSDYQRTQQVCGVDLPPGMPQCGRMPEPIFTPATKAAEGHDENIDFSAASEVAGASVMSRLRDISLQLYREAAAHAESRGIILADTKFEFGFALDASGAVTDELLLIDEILTPDSSRFWPADEYEPGRDQDSFDKQYVRNYLQSLVDAGTWDKEPPGPALPEEIIRNTLRRYAEARTRLFGE